MPWKKKHPHIAYWFLKIAEPRGIRLMQFAIYACLAFASIGVISDPPSTFQSVLGSRLVYVFGGFILFGSAMGLIAVLPGIWWLERVAIILMGTGIGMYVVTISSLNASVVNLAVSTSLMITLIQRWTEIKGSQLAPKEV